MFSTELWERFSYYGMRALLVLYMVGTLLRPEHASHVLGLPALRSALEAMSGPLDVQPFASQIYSLDPGFVYVIAILSSSNTDHWLGERLTVAIGANLMMTDFFLITFYRLALR